MARRGEKYYGCRVKKLKNKKTIKPELRNIVPSDLSLDIEEVIITAGKKEDKVHILKNPSPSHHMLLWYKANLA